ncbi:MAG: hydroxymethylglutaryl-CoA lyase [Desulfuromonas sp.]|nr:MAG: hydroxymethylglutaryl-CoA lyase [Desulfuromonas sp.]
MNLPGKVKIVEVGVRDGLQNETSKVSAADRIALVDRLSDCGLPAIEVGSFVSTRSVPQMADTDTVFAGIQRHPGVSYPVLVPNLQGLRHAVDAGVKDIAFFASASESFSQRNINCSIEQSLVRLADIAAEALPNGLRIRGYVSCVAGCPYEGEVPVSRVVDVAVRLAEFGCFEISLGDTIGVGTPGQVQRIIEGVAGQLSRQQLAVHFHDTYGQALANILVALQEGVSVVDSSVAGLGGCPYAPGATGNVATEDVLYMLQGLGVETGVNLKAVIEAGHAICKQLGRINGSKVARALGSAQAACPGMT